MVKKHKDEVVEKKTEDGKVGVEGLDAEYASQGPVVDEEGKVVPGEDKAASHPSDPVHDKAHTGVRKDQVEGFVEGTASKGK